ncbi:MAG: NAD(P)/FAD-dependent oxidoreductase [Tateyamaria sp.]
MKRIFSDFAYGPGPREGCWWDETVTLPVQPQLDCDKRTDVAIVGGGFTGLSAALRLARAGASVAVVDAQNMGWGASGRNGGFCCLGGGMRSNASLDRQFGAIARREWRRTEKEAVDRVAALIDQQNLDVDRHSNGETCLAHRSRDAVGFEAHARAVQENYGVEPTILSAADLPGEGLNGPFHGAITVPVGFGLNPRKLLAGMVAACRAESVALFDHTPVTSVRPGVVETAHGAVRADRILITTNGYSSEDIPTWLAARYMPAQSTVIVTRPLSDAELNRQGWTSEQMSYDTRHLLHYFRLMPDRRFLFGMRGGLMTGRTAERKARQAVVRDFRAMFPGWKDIPIQNAWSGLVCLSRARVPIIGPIPEAPGVAVALAYHGNGVAMGIHGGVLLADWAMHDQVDHLPKVSLAPSKPFPLGRLRRAIMPAIYSAFKVADARP